MKNQNLRTYKVWIELEKEVIAEDLETAIEFFKNNMDLSEAEINGVLIK